MFNVKEWNDKIYRNSDGSWVVENGLHAKELWEEFKIESFPLFKDKCHSHIPETWAKEVRTFIKQVQSELGDKITFNQLKEKWCELTVYFSTDDEESGKRMRILIRECKQRLIDHGVHPPFENEETK